MGKAIDTCRDNLGYFNPPNVYRPAIIDIRLVGEYSAEDGATNTYRITQNDGKVFEFDVKNGSGGSAGRSVTSVEQIQISTESLGKNIARIYLSDGTYTDVEIRNGAQGEVGPQGERGPAGIDSVEASIGTNDPTQVPSVDKELTEGVLSLTFNNIKGQKGDKGDQGNTGSSVDYPYELVNNVTTDDATKGLSAAQGVVLDGKISQLGQEKLSNEFSGVLLDGIEVIEGRGIIKSNGSTYESANLCVTALLPLSYRAKLLVYGVQGVTATCLALYDENKAFIESADNAFVSYTWEELQALGAKYYRASFNTDSFRQGLQYFANYNCLENVNTVRPVGFSVNGNKVTIDSVSLFRNLSGVRTAYANGDSSSHSPVEYTLGANASILVVNSDNKITTRANNSSIVVGDIVLLTYSIDQQKFDGGGLLYPALLEPLITNNENAIESINAELGDGFDVSQIDLSQFQQFTYIIQASGQWGSATNRRSILIPITPGRAYKVVGLVSGLTCYIGVLADDTIPTSNTYASFADGYNSRIGITKDEVYSFIAPVDAKALYVNLKITDGSNVTPAVYNNNSIQAYKQDALVPGLNIKKIIGYSPLGGGNINLNEKLASLQQAFDNVPVCLDANGWEMPLTSGMNYALKKAAQAVGIQYTTIAVSPGLDGGAPVQPGPKTGFPYSSTKENRKFIGWEVSQRTFMTAIRNKYGLYYTENIYGDASESGYGFTYHGVNCGTYYGMVCSIFTGFCIGYAIPWDTAQFAYLAQKGDLVKISEQNAQGVHICDLVWRSGHCLLVTKVKRDEYGNVTNVQMTESLGPVHSTDFTAEEFNTYLHTTWNCIIYRPTLLYKNSYIPSEFIAVRGEVAPPEFVYNDDICFYAGDYSAMRVGQPAWLNYTKGSYTGLKIFKGSTLIDTINLPADADVHKIDITQYMSGYGKYSAVLTDGVNDSAPTYWELVNADVTLSGTIEDAQIGFEPIADSVPWWIQVCDNKGVAYCWYEITQKDIADALVSLNLQEMMSEQYGGTMSDTKYLRVMYKCDYGGVASEMIEINP